MGFHEDSLEALEVAPGIRHCVDCWAIAIGLTSTEDKLRLGHVARTLRRTFDPIAETGDCGKCQNKGVLTVRSVPRIKYGGLRDGYGHVKA